MWSKKIEYTWKCGKWGVTLEYMAKIIWQEAIQEGIQQGIQPNGIRIFFDLLEEGFSRAKAQAIAGIDDETVESALQVGQSNTI